jgi:ubiquinone/menaquinone biosynthesis C-methylase UbiE
MNPTDPYIPALRHKSLTPLYDPLLKWVMREDTFKRRLIQQANLAAGHRVLDLGCGTATLTILIKQLHPDVEVVGLDGDPQVLEIGRAKAAAAGVSLVLDQGLAQSMPYPGQSFDRVVSSLVFHHLTTDNKQRALREVFRVLKPGGELHMVDFGKPRHPAASFVAVFTQRLEEASANVKGLLPEMMRSAGLVEVEEPARFMTLFGSLSSYTARKALP